MPRLRSQQQRLHCGGLLATAKVAFWHVRTLLAPFSVGFARLARPHGDARGGHSRPRPTALFRISPLLSTRRYVSPPRQVRVPRSATEHRPGQWWSTCSHCCSATTYLPRFESCGTAVADKPFVMHTQYVITSDRACIIGDLPRLDPACTAGRGPDAVDRKAKGPAEHKDLISTPI